MWLLGHNPAPTQRASGCFALAAVMGLAGMQGASGNFVPACMKVIVGGLKGVDLRRRWEDSGLIRGTAVPIFLFLTGCSDTQRHNL